MSDLTDLERDLLEFERLTWKYAAARETAVRERFGMSGWRHAQVVSDLIDRPEALAHDAQLVRRLLRLRQARRFARSGRRTFSTS